MLECVKHSKQHHAAKRQSANERRAIRSILDRADRHRHGRNGRVADKLIAALRANQLPMRHSYATSTAAQHEDLDIGITPSMNSSSRNARMPAMAPKGLRPEMQGDCWRAIANSEVERKRFEPST